MAEMVWRRYGAQRRELLPEKLAERVHILPSCVCVRAKKISLSWPKQQKVFRWGPAHSLSPGPCDGSSISADGAFILAMQGIHRETQVRTVELDRVDGKRGRALIDAIQPSRQGSIRGFVDLDHNAQPLSAAEYRSAPVSVLSLTRLDLLRSLLGAS
jgi:hypothetical protein